MPPSMPLFCPIFKQCIPLFYRRAHKCGKKGCKWGSNINLYYLIPAAASSPALLRALHGNSHNSHWPELFARKRNSMKLTEKLIRTKQITLVLGAQWRKVLQGKSIVVCVSPLLLITRWSNRVGRRGRRRRPLPEATLPKSPPCSNAPHSMCNMCSIC